MFYSLTPRQTSAVSLLMICSLVARYAPPISYNFLNLISLGDNKTTYFEKRMGTIDKAVPFFGTGFNQVYPLIMVIYTILVASNFFDRIISFFGNWKIFRLQTETDDVDGFDPSGLLILQKERTWLEQGRKVGEHVIPLARNFNDASLDLESGSSRNKDDTVEMMIKSDDLTGSSSRPPRKDETQRYSGSKEAISTKYAAMREQNKPVESIASAKVSLLDAGNPQPTNTTVPAGLASKWASMKQGFQNFKTNIEAKKFIPLRQSQEPKLLARASSAESLDEIFQRLKRPAEDQGRSGDGDEDEDELETSSR